jgi:hypothetical protein
LPHGAVRTNHDDELNHHRQPDSKDLYFVRIPKAKRGDAHFFLSGRLTATLAQPIVANAL